jgi:hypothetical protein
MESRKLVKIYRTRMKLLPVSLDIEMGGATVRGSKLAELKADYAEQSQRKSDVCVGIARSLGVELELPKGTRNDALASFLLGRRRVAERRGRQVVSSHWEQCPGLNLEPMRFSEKTGLPSLDDETLENWSDSLPRGTKAKLFVDSLRSRSELRTAVSYLEGYERYWQSADGGMEWFILHPSLNPTGTDTLRFSSKEPNSQNVSKQSRCNLRRCFGPAPGREWWSMDAENIQLRIPFFEAGEQDVIEVFNHPERPPYFGSYHLVIFDLLHPALFAEYGRECKTLFEDTWYQWVKNGNFAIQFGAQRAKADATYGVAGAYDKIADRFRKVAALNLKYQEQARRTGYVETIPDRSVDPERGYPLLVSRSEDGRVVPTTPFCYHVSGTADWWMGRAMVKCAERLREWRQRGFDARIVFQVHDELVFDMPRAAHPKVNLRASNWGRAKELRNLMASGGEDMGVPTPVSVEYHEESWAVGAKMA